MTKAMKRRQITLFKNVLKEFEKEMVDRFSSKLGKRTGWMKSTRVSEIAADLARDAANQERSGIIYGMMRGNVIVRRPEKNVDIANRAMMLWNIGMQKQQREYRKKFLR